MRIILLYTPLLSAKTVVKVEWEGTRYLKETDFVTFDLLYLLAQTCDQLWLLRLHLECQNKGFWRFLSYYLPFWSLPPFYPYLTRLFITSKTTTKVLKSQEQYWYIPGGQVAVTGRLVCCFLAAAHMSQLSVCSPQNCARWRALPFHPAPDNITFC